MTQNLNNKIQRKNTSNPGEILCIGSPSLSALQKSERQDFCRKILARLQNLITEKEITKGELHI